MADISRNLQKPPLVEVYCEFIFDPAEGEDWDGLRISDFIGKMGSAYSQRRMLHFGGGRTQVHDEEQVAWEPNETDEAVPLFRLSTEDGCTTVQVGEDLLVVNQLPPYYGWSRFSPRVLQAMAAYEEVWRPKRIAQAYLHYADRVFIPENDFEFRDYFNLHLVVPEGFNKPYTNFSVSFDLEGCGKGDILSVALQQDSSANPDGMTFVLNWDYGSTSPVELDRELLEIQEWLERAHGCCSAHFDALFTDRCFALFDPYGGP
jgi:uncharacterized protein (TIGR04255 family)